MITSPHPFHHGFFHNRLDIRRAEELALYAGRFCHPELSVLRQPLLPGKAFGSLKKPFKGFRMEASHFNQNPLCRAQKNICPAHGSGVAPESDAAVLNLHYFISQIRNFPFQDGLKPEMAWRNQFICFHKYLFPIAGRALNRRFSVSPATFTYYTVFYEIMPVCILKIQIFLRIPV